MLNRIDQLFSVKSSNVLNIFCTAGFPKLDSLPEVLKALRDAKVDMVEIGIPYSDPLADGPVIQYSNSIALRNGISLEALFDQLEDCRTYFDPPLILMGYLNPIMQYGIKEFCTKAKNAGIDGVILPDLPIMEFKTQYASYFREAGLHFIFLVTPETSEARIREIDSISNGFIYAVSSSSTTGGKNDLSTPQEYFKKLHQMKLKNPVLVGFGINNRETFDLASRYTNGGIIGSAYIKALESAEDINTVTKLFVDGIR